MTKKTELMSDDVVNCIKNGMLAARNGMFEQAWEHFEQAYDCSQATAEQKGIIAYEMYKIMKEIPDTNPLIRSLKETEKDLLMMSKTKALTNKYVKKYIGRKQLKISAECDNRDGLIDYGLSCIGCGDKKSFPFDCNDQNLETAIAWADKLLKSKDADIKHAGNIIYAKYYFVKGIDNDSQVYIDSFGDYVVEAYKIKLEDQYTYYFLGHLYANPKYSMYENGSYSNIKTGYDYFCEATKIAKDPKIKKSAEDLKNMIETKFPEILK